MINIRSLLWRKLVNIYPVYLREMYKMDIGANARISWKAHLDKSINPRGIHIGDRTLVLNGAMILSHDSCRNLFADTIIGKDCIIGVRSIILPGVKIGDSSVVGAGSVVTKDIPDHCVVAGNPAIVIRTGVVVEKSKIVSDGSY